MTKEKVREALLAVPMFAQVLNGCADYIQDELVEKLLKELKK